MVDDGYPALITRVAVLEERARQQELRVTEAFAARDRARVETLATYDEKLEARDRAVLKAEQATNQRLEGMNEFREALAHQQQTFLTKDEYSFQHNVLIEKVNRSQDMLSPLVGGDVLGRLTRNTDALTTLQTARSSTTQSWAAIASIISTLASLGAVIAVLLSFKH